MVQKSKSFKFLKIILKIYGADGGIQTHARYYYLLDYKSSTVDH